MKQSAFLRPVSHKAYMRFIERIYIVVTDSAKRRAMLAALDSYFDGNRDTYDSNLTPDCVMVFGMLRFEIDLAMARSAKARMRGRGSKKSAESRKSIPAKNVKPAKNVQPKGDSVATGVENAVPTGPESAESASPVLRKSRRARRAAARMTKPKTRWGRLG